MRSRRPRSSRSAGSRRRRCPIWRMSRPRCAPIRRRRATLIDKGDVDAAIAGAAKPMQRTYVWPYQMHGSIGPSCAVADYQDDGIRVWSGTQNPHLLRADLALLLERPESEIDVDPDGGGRLLRPQLRRRRHRRCGAAVARGRPPGARAADARAGARVGAQGHRATDGRQWRTGRRRRRRRPTISPRAIRPTARRRWRCC